MKNKMVVSRDLTPDWIEKIGKMLAEIFRQMHLWFKEPGKGLSIKQLQAFIEHRNPFLKITKVVDESRERDIKILLYLLTVKDAYTDEWKKSVKVSSLDGEFFIEWCGFDGSINGEEHHALKIFFS